ncbi:MAG TPA: cobaltochelatase subunit CobS, partial [Pseudolabrys sp.]|nr:cobaltochelatase subunit CobS [Pseudolabrys sp.]
MTTEPQGLDPAAAPDIMVDVRETFGIDANMKVPAFSKRNDEYVPEEDTAYRFDRE